MSKTNLTESQQQGQKITIGTQGNEDQPTPQDDDLNYLRETAKDDRSIPYKEKSSAANQRNAENSREQHG